MKWIVALSFFVILILWVPFARASSLLNADPTLGNPDQDKTLFNPHVFPTSYRGDWGITFEPHKMTMWLNNTSPDMVHVAGGAFYDVNWSYGQNRMLPRDYDVTARIRGRITQIHDGSWLRAGVALAGRSVKGSFEFFTESDFFWGSGLPSFSVLGLFTIDRIRSSDCVLIHDYQYGSGEAFDLTLNLTSKLEANWNGNYNIWAVYPVIEAKNAAMKLEISELSIWYELRDEAPSDLLLNIGLALLFIGFAVAFVAVILMNFSGVKGAKGKARGGGIVIIGPIPIIFGTDKESLKIILVLAIVLVALLLVLALFSFGIFR